MNKNYLFIAAAIALSVIALFWILPAAFGVSTIFGFVVLLVYLGIMYYAVRRGVFGPTAEQTAKNAEKDFTDLTGR